MIKFYGKDDPDPALKLAVTQLIGDNDATIMMFQRTPINAKPCQYPGRLRFEVLVGDTPKAAYQNLDGSIELPQL